MIIINYTISCKSFYKKFKLYMQKRYIKIISVLFIICTDLIIIFYISPDDIIPFTGKTPLIFSAILFQGIVSYSIASLFLSFSDRLLISIGVIVFLLLSSFFGFQILNTILLLLFIIIIHIII